MHQFVLVFIVLGAAIGGTYFLVVSHADATSNQRWFVPNYVPQWFPHNYADASWGSYFTNPGVLDSTLSQTDVMQFWPEAIVSGDTNNWFENLLPSLRSHQTKIAINAGYVGRYINGVGSCSGATTANNDIKNYLKPIYDKGATITYIVMDGFPVNLLQSPCNDTAPQAVRQLVAYMKTIHQSYPSVQIGLDVNFPQWAYGNTPSYIGTWVPLTDYKALFGKMVKNTQANGEHIAFLQVDNPYDYAVGTHPSSWPGVSGVDWVGRILQLEQQARSYNIPFGLMYNSESAGQGSDSNGGSDSQFYNDTISYARLFAARGGKPNQTVFISWYPNHPSSLLPASQAYSFTYDYNALLNTLNTLNTVSNPDPPPTPPPSTESITPIYQLINAAGYRFWTMNTTERDSAISTYGYRLEGTEFYADSNNGNGAIPVYRLTNAAGSRLYTIYTSEVKSAPGYGYSYDGVAYYAYSTAATGRVALYRLQTPKGFYYTTSISIRNTLIAGGDIDNGISFYVPAQP